MFLLTRDGFIYHCPMKPVICQLLNKFDMFTFVASHTVCSILSFSVNGGDRGGGERVLDFWCVNTKGDNFKGGIKLRWNYGTDVKKS